MLSLCFQVFGDNLPSSLIEEVPYSNETEAEYVLTANIWHVACDIMGDNDWVADPISNPNGIRSKEGHRKAFCGNPENWLIFLNEYGVAVRLDEIKAGSTGGTITARIYTDGTYSQETDASILQVGGRVYFTTQNGNQTWYHQGTVYVDTPSETDPVVPQTEPSPVETEQPTEIQTEPIQTEAPQPIIETDTEIVTETDHNTKIETESETVTELFTESEVVILPQIFTEVITEENTETVTEVITEAVTEKQTEKVTELNTEKQSEPVLRNWNSIEIEYTIPEIRHTEVIPSVDQPTDVLSRQDPMGAVLGSNREKETEQAKKKKRNKSNIQGINRENGTEVLIISSATVPKTGDDTDILRWVIAMILAGLVIGSVTYAFVNRD